MSITYQAGDALLHVVNSYLRGDLWKEHVYSKVAKSNVWDMANVWVVCRVTGDVPNNFRGDRDSRTLTLAVQAVSQMSRTAEVGASRIYDLLHLSGVNDRRSSVSLGTHDEWRFLSCSAGRAIRLVPSKEVGTRFYENGYVFEVTMEAKNGYV